MIKMIVKYNSLLNDESRQKLAKYITEAWNKEGVIVTDKMFDIKNIILCNDKQFEIKVINLEESSVKKRKNILKKIQKLFKRKNKGSSLDI